MDGSRGFSLRKSPDGSVLSLHSGWTWPSGFSSNIVLPDKQTYYCIIEQILKSVNNNQVENRVISELSNVGRFPKDRPSVLP